MRFCKELWSKHGNIRGWPQMFRACVKSSVVCYWVQSFIADFKVFVVDQIFVRGWMKIFVVNQKCHCHLIPKCVWFIHKCFCWCPNFLWFGKELCGFVKTLRSRIRNVPCWQIFCSWLDDKLCRCHEMCLVDPGMFVLCRWPQNICGWLYFLWFVKKIWGWLCNVCSWCLLLKTLWYAYIFLWFSKKLSSWSRNVCGWPHILCSWKYLWLASMSLCSENNFILAL